MSLSQFDDLMDAVTTQWGSGRRLRGRILLSKTLTPLDRHVFKPFALKI